MTASKRPPAGASPPPTTFLIQVERDGQWRDLFIVSAEDAPARRDRIAATTGLQLRIVAAPPAPPSRILPSTGTGRRISQHPRPPKTT